MNKFHNIEKTCKQSHDHDSQKEARCCDELELRRKCRDIASYTSQVKFELQEGFCNSQGEKIRPITYTPDFVIEYLDGKKEIVDVKGGKATKTQAWQLKWKMLQHKLRHEKEYRFSIM